MKVSIREIKGNWDLGFALDKHVLESIFTGENEHGHPQFDTTRSEAGEALFQLKYRNDWSKIAPLATELAVSIFPKFENVGLLIPMPASNVRPRQPVTELTTELSVNTGTPVFDRLLQKTPNGKQLKNIVKKEDKIEALKGCFTVHDIIQGVGPWNALLVDDIFDTGASLEAACTALRGYSKIRKIYVATISWK